MAKNTGKDYEIFVSKIQQAILNSDEYVKQKNIKIERNKKIIDNNDIMREFDLYWEYDIGGLTYRTVIECKDYKEKISIEKIDALIGKLNDLPELKGVFATKVGYQSGAKTKAEKNKIDLLIVREQKDSDWKDKDGNPLIKIININTHLKKPTAIREFFPEIDGDWAREHTDIDLNKPLKYEGQIDQIIIEDKSKGEKYSLDELVQNLKAPNNENSGIFSLKEETADTYIIIDKLKLKLHSYKLEYEIFPETIFAFQIDFTKELIGVVEYLSKGHKKSIFKNGIVKE